MQKGLDIRIDHRTLEAQGIEREPTIHHGVSTQRKRQNEEIKQRNEAQKPENIAEYMFELKQCCEILSNEINKTQSEEKKEMEEMKREFMQEYQRLKILNEIRTDRERIKNRARQLSKEIRKELTPHEKILQMRNQSILDTVKEQDYTEITQGFTARQAEAVKESREMEKEMRLELELRL